MKPGAPNPPPLHRPAPAPTEEQLRAFLLDTSSYPHRPKRVQMLQTHASYIFIAPPFVFKIKKPVNFGFLDFSTLEQRRYFCEREVELNRRLCPEIYLGVQPICRRHGRLGFGSGGEIVEYAVRMRRLSQRHFLNHRLRRGEVGRNDLKRITRVLKAFYTAQTPTAEVGQWGRIERLRISTAENFLQTRPYIGRTLSKAAFEAIRRFTNRSYAQRAALFRQRVREQRIRDCHGDLHLDHIHITPRSLCVYDCIEFNDRLRYVDIANDVAFLAMDLDHNGRPDLSRYFVQAMAGVLDDPGLLQLMDFYKCYRACVRGKVESFRSAAAETPDAERQKSRDAARAYFRLALRYAVAGSQPMALLVMGRVASGKSSLAGALAHELGWELLSSDRIRKELFGVPAGHRGDADTRAQRYSQTATNKTYTALFRRAAANLRQGKGVVVDATFSRRKPRRLFREKLDSMGATYCFVELCAGEASRRKRLRRREESSDEISDARLEDMAVLDGAYEEPAELSDENLVRVRSAGTPPRTLLQTIRQLVDRAIL